MFKTWNQEQVVVENKIKFRHKDAKQDQIDKQSKSKLDSRSKSGFYYLAKIFGG